VRQFDGNHHSPRVPQQLARAGIAAQASHGPKLAARQHGRRPEHVARAGRDDGAGPESGYRGEQREVCGSDGHLVGEQDERCTGAARQRIDPGHERARESLPPLPVYDDSHGESGQLGPHARGMSPEHHDAASGATRERDACRPSQQRLASGFCELLRAAEAA
jgi:hypothetical protein